MHVPFKRVALGSRQAKQRSDVPARHTSHPSTSQYAQLPEESMLYTVVLRHTQDPLMISVSSRSMHLSQVVVLSGRKWHIAHPRLQGTQVSFLYDT